MNTSENDGNQPFSQMTRDVLATNDHDEIVRHSVMLKTIIDAQIRLETQIKDLIAGQVAALTSWEASSKVIHDAQDIRIRKLEDLSVQYVPLGNELDEKMKKVIVDIQSLRENKSEIIGGWKAFLFIIGGVGGLIGGVYTVINIAIFFLHICSTGCH